MESRNVGVSHLRTLTAESLKMLEEVLVIMVDGRAVASIAPQAERERVAGILAEMPPSRRTDEVLEEVRLRLERILAGVEKLLELESMMEAVVRHVIEAPRVVYDPLDAKIADAPGPRPSLPQPNATCRHCGQSWFSPSKHATICSECKATGHTNAPAECPKCTAGEQI